ncbi:MAG: hypothetical protein ACK47B_17525 [Armatimonadota bacterium]
MHSPPCPYCRAPLRGLYRFQGVCESLRCRTARLREVEAQRAKQLSAHRKRQSRALERERQRLGDEPGGSPSTPVETVALPANTRPLVPLSREERAGFREHLERLCAQRGRAGTEPVLPSDSAPGPTQAGSRFTPGVSATACATCRGFCCLSGGTHAYLRLEALERYLAEHPDDTAGFVDTYLERLPEVHFQDGCVFQGGEGCVLPRRLRSAICNEHLCPALKELRDRLDASQATRWLLVALDDAEVIRSQLVPVPPQGNRPAPANEAVREPGPRVPLAPGAAFDEDDFCRDVRDAEGHR